MDLRPLDFESSASTNFTTPPYVLFVRRCPEKDADELAAQAKEV